MIKELIPLALSLILTSKEDLSQKGVILLGIWFYEYMILSSLIRTNA
jgi:hypothetical protein